VKENLKKMIIVRIIDNQGNARSVKVNFTSDSIEALGKGKKP
jgi:hypothetical protein